jgi:hypothetical protein
VEAFEAELGSLHAFVRALLGWDAGEIELAPGEDAVLAEVLLTMAAALLGRDVRSSWVAGGRVLRWVCVPLRPALR